MEFLGSQRYSVVLHNGHELGDMMGDTWQLAKRHCFNISRLFSWPVAYFDKLEGRLNLDEAVSVQPVISASAYNAA